MRSKKKLSPIHYITYGLLIVGSTITIIRFSPQSKQPTTSQAYVPSLYSDTHITPQAIGKDSRLTHLGFTDNNLNNRSNKALVYEAWQTVQGRERYSSAKSFERGTWVWTPIQYMTKEYIDTIVSDASREKLNVIYVSIDSYLDIYTLSLSPSTRTQFEEQKNTFDETLSYLIRQAQSNGIQVDAEAGWRNWAQEGHTYKPFVIVNYVKDFNASHKEQFRGIQYDIEPYLLDEYKTEPEKTLQQFIGLVDDTAQYLKGSSLAFSVVIPEFYDGGGKLSPQLWYKNTYSYTINHLLEVLRPKQNTSIIMMSYRDKAEGENGIIDISRTEIQEANKPLYTTPIIVAVETGDITPSYVTFFGKPKRYFTEQLAQVQNVLKDEPSFGGVAVHYINTFVTLK